MEWHDLYRAINTHRKEAGMSGDQARTLASQVWEVLKDSGGGGPSPPTGTTTVRGVSGELHVQLPVVPMTEITDAAGVDVARGIVDYLLEHAQRPSSREVLEARATQVLGSARRGGSGVADTVEHQIGYHIGELLVLLVVDMELDWDDLQHRDLRDWNTVPGREDPMQALPVGGPVSLGRRLPPGIGGPPASGTQGKSTLESILTSQATAEAVKILGDLIR